MISSLLPMLGAIGALGMPSAAGAMYRAEKIRCEHCARTTVAVKRSPVRTVTCRSCGHEQKPESTRPSRRSLLRDAMAYLSRPWHA